MANRTSLEQDLKHHELGLTDDQLIEMYRTIVFARRIDERALLLQRAGKINFHISGLGQEMAQVGAAFALQPGVDYLLPYYRDFAMVLAFGMTAREIMLSFFAKAEDPNSGGRQMPGHFGYKALNIVTGSSPVTTQVPHAAGIALAAKMNRQPFVSFVTFGEGSSNQGDFHEGLNFAAVHKLPAIFMCENNQYAISVPYRKQVACENIADRGIGYGMPGIRVDGTDILEVYRVVKEARERAIRGEGPTLIEAVMYRLAPHSTSDNDLAYRTKEEVELHRNNDGLPKFKKYLYECGIWSDEQDAKLMDELAEIIKDATEYAERAPYPDPQEVFTHVYGEEE